MDFFLCVLGLVFIIEGIPYFAFPDKLKNYLSKIQEIQDSRLRIMGLVAMITGLILLYFGRN
jgi:uncharacterized protein YjeT (DUF2065 family)